MSFDDIKMLLSQPETLNEGLAELDTYNNSLLSTVDELKDSNNKYKETNANLAFKLSTPVGSLEVEKSEHDILNAKLDDFVKEVIK